MDQYVPAAVSILFHGLAYAMILYVISVGLSVTMGLMGFANLAHGVFAMAGGYLTVSFMNPLGLDFVSALVVAVLAVAAISVVLERFLYVRLYEASEIEQVLFTIGLIFMAIAVAKFIWGPLPQHLPLPGVLHSQIEMMGRSFPTYRAFIIVIGMLIAFGLWAGIERTSFGARIRASVDNRRMARSVGIDTDRLFTFTFALGSGLAAFGGGVGAEIMAIHPGYPVEHLVYFLIVVAVGGMGSVRGPFVAALLLGVSDTACKYLLPELGAFFIYVALFAALLWRPAGLFGRA
ncbi:MAG TPA: branched-chain amino acid ABC transporter permease [Azospirillum sp.]|nr:branched-chain amino acid ABC transporter permease [Azospirillum sp.]